MELIIGIAVGIIIGLVVGTLIFRRRYIPVGDLRIDRSDPTSEPFLFLELGTDVRTISGMKTVTTRISSRTNNTPYYGVNLLKGEMQYGRNQEIAG